MQLLHWRNIGTKYNRKLQLISVELGQACPNYTEIANPAQNFNKSILNS